MATIRLFVYGTLKRGMPKNGYLAGQEYLGPARTEVGYRLYDCGRYPGLVATADGGVIDGELWRVGEAILPQLDAYEGVPDLYQRGEVRLQDVHGPVITYFYVADVTRLEDCGRSWPPNRSNG
jgi:gamma-glutamylcyclotransferase (GGCT)/AIG2-like uncharacterized protein YtfP